MYKGFIFLFLAALLAGCATHRTASVAWEDTRIKVTITPPGGSTLFTSPALRCLSCNTVLPAIPLSENDQGIAYLKINEAANSIATHFHIEAGGLDSALILQPRSPEEATNYYKLTTPLTGRILITQPAIIYDDSTMSRQIGTLERGDEANLFSESDVFYYVHHPDVSHPVVVLRSHAIRLQ